MEVRHSLTPVSKRELEEGSTLRTAEGNCDLWACLNIQREVSMETMWTTTAGY